MNTMKLFFGGTQEEARNAYKAWWDQQRGIELVGTPVVEREGTAWKLTVWYRLISSN